MPIAQIPAFPAGHGPVSAFGGLSRNVERFRERLVFKAHRLLHHSTLGSRVIKKKRRGSEKNPRDMKSGCGNFRRSLGGVAYIVHGGLM